MELNIYTIDHWNVTEIVPTSWTINGQYPKRDVWTWVLSISLFITAIVTLLGNSFVLTVFFVEKSLLKSHFNIFLINLTTTDIAISVTAIPLYGINYFFGLWPDILGPELCAIWVFCDWGMTFASVYTLMAISIDRYWAVCWSSHYRTINTRTRALLMVAATWLLVLLMWVPAFIVDQLDGGSSTDSECMWSIEKNEKFSIFMAVAGYHVPTCVIIFCYIRLYISMRQSRVKVLKKNRMRSTPDESRQLKSNSALTINSSTSVNDAIALRDLEQDPCSLNRDFTSCIETETTFCDGAISETMNSPGVREERTMIPTDSTLAVPTDNSRKNSLSLEVPATNSPGVREEKAMIPEDSTLAVPIDNSRKSSLSLEVPPTNLHVCGGRMPTRPRSFTYGSTRDHVYQKHSDHYQNGSLNHIRHRSTPPIHHTSQGQGNHSRSLYLSRQRREYKLFKRISYIIITYLVLWLPFHVVFDLLLAGVHVPDTWYTLATLMCYFNSTINPILYALGSPKMREAFKSILSCRKQ